MASARVQRDSYRQFSHAWCDLLLTREFATDMAGLKISTGSTLRITCMSLARYINGARRAGYSYNNPEGPPKCNLVECTPRYVAVSRAISSQSAQYNWRVALDSKLRGS